MQRLTTERLDIQRQLPAIEPGSLDVLLCLDVLEHLHEPKQVLESMSTLLRPGAVLIATLPNMQYIKVSLPLLFGHFDYADEGVLDRTHIRFFTRRSAIRLFNDAGFDIELVERLHIPGWRGLVAWLLPLAGWRDLWTRQLMFVATRRK